METEFKAGDSVRIKSGAFTSFPGRVESVSDEGLLTVAVEVLGHTTLLDLPPWDVEKIRPPDEPGTFYSNN